MRQLLLITLLLTLCFGTASGGEIPGLVTHQGYITDVDGGPVTGDLAMSVALYAEPVGGQSLWFEEFPDVHVDNGFYYLQFGEEPGLEQVLAEHPALYLEIRIGDEVGKPRQRIGSVPYAFLAGDAVGDIHPASVTSDGPVSAASVASDGSVSVAGEEVIDDTGKWVGDTTGMGGVQKLTAEAPLTGGEITDSGAIGLPRADAETDGYLAGEDFAVLAAKQPEIDGVCGEGECMVAVELDETGALSTPVCLPCVGEGSVATVELGDFGCLEGQVLKWDLESGTWACAGDQGGDNAYFAGTGLNLANDTFSLMTCSEGDILKWADPEEDGDWTWECQPDSDSGGTIQALEATLPAFVEPGQNGEIWTVHILQAKAPDDEQAGQDGYITGDYLSEFEGKQDQLQEQCEKGTAIRVITADGFVQCQDTTYFAGAGLQTQGNKFSLLLTCAEDNVLVWDGLNWECGPTVTAIATEAPLIGGPILTQGTLSILQSSLIQDGYLAKGDFQAFAGKQERVFAKCNPGEAIRVINADGTVQCEKDDSTAYEPGDGINAVGTKFSLEEKYLDGSAHDDRFVNEKQKDSIVNEMVPDGELTAHKLSQSDCEDGQVLKWRAKTGAWACSEDVDTTVEYVAGPGLQLEGGAMSLLLTCESGQVLKWSGQEWACQPDDDSNLSGDDVDQFVSDNGFAMAGDLSVVATTGSYLDLSDTPPGLADGDDDTLAGLGCGDGQVAKRDGDAWVCGDDLDENTTYSGNDFVVSDQTCSEAQKVAGVSENGSLLCADDIDTDDNTTYAAGPGLKLTETTFALDDAGCKAGEVFKRDQDNGTWVCASDSDSGGDITGVKAGPGLDGGGASGTVTLSADISVLQKRVADSCKSGTSIRAIDENGHAACEEDDNTTYAAGPGLKLAGTTFSVNDGGCAAADVLKRNGANDGWFCAKDAGLASESDPQVGLLSSGKWCISDGSKVNCESSAPVMLESDPVFGGHAASGVTATRLSQWDAAHGWGDHGTAGYLTSYTDTNANSICTGTNRYLDGDGNCDLGYLDADGVDAVNDSVSSGELDGVCSSNGKVLKRSAGTWVCAEDSGLTVESDPQVGSLASGKWCISDGSKVNCATTAPVTSESDPVFSGHAASTISAGQVSQWDGAYSWGDHANAGYLTSYSNTNAGTICDGDHTYLDGNGNCDAGYLDADGVDATNDSVSSSELDNLCNADGKILKRSGGAWACASDSGILAESDPQVGSLASGKWCISDGSKVNCATTAPVTSESDPVFSGHAASTISAGQVSQWDGAYSWGDHANAGYLTSYSNTNAGTICDGDHTYLDGNGNCDAGYLDADGVDATNDSVSSSELDNLCNADGKILKRSGGAWACASDSGILAESDPQVGSLASGKWCISDGSKVNCATTAPVTTESDPQVGANTTNYVPRWNGSSLVTSTIYDNGEVGIGTASPERAFHMYGDPHCEFLLENGEFKDDAAKRDYRKLNIFVKSQGTHFRTLNHDNSGGNTWMTVDNQTGEVGINSTDPDYQLHVEGTLYVSGTAYKPGGGSWAASSDRRLKKNVQTIRGALDSLLGLRGVFFEWLEPDQQGGPTGRQIGMIAQEVEEVFPGWVGTDKKGFKTLAFRGFEALAVEALRELKRESDRLAEENARLRGRLAEMELHFGELDRRLAAMEGAR